MTALSRRRLARSVLAALALLTLASSVGSRSAIAQPPDSACPPPTDPGQTITVYPGDQFTIALASNRTTGYQWVLADQPDENVIQLVSHVYAAPGTGLLGAGGVECWTYQAVSGGGTLVSLNYVRPWETNAPPGQTAQFLVVVE